MTPAARSNCIYYFERPSNLLGTFLSDVITYKILYIDILNVVCGHILIKPWIVCFSLTKLSTIRPMAAFSMSNLGHLCTFWPGRKSYLVKSPIGVSIGRKPNLGDLDIAQGSKI